MFDCQRINLAMEGVLTKRLNACNFHGLAQCVKGKLESWDVDLIGCSAFFFRGDLAAFSPRGSVNKGTKKQSLRPHAVSLEDT